MITNIKIEKVVVSNGVLNQKIYTPIDITNQLEMPILDTSQLDGVLDTTQISLLNHNPTPLKPFTRIIITLTEDDKDGSETEYIYRLVDNDIVTNIVSGPKPIYRHSISLIEITKQLERVAVDNLTFTNYLDDNYGTDTPIKLLYDYNDVKNISTGSSMLLVINVMGYYGIQLQDVKYASDSNYFYGPYRILQKSGYKLATKTDVGALLVVADDTPTELIEGVEEGELFNPATQIMLKDVTPQLETVIIGDYVKYYNAAADNTINTNVKCDIKFTYYTTQIFKLFGWFKQATHAELKEFYIELPNGGRQNLNTNGSFEFTQTGKHTIYQKYAWQSCELLFHWEIVVVDSLNDMPQKYTIRDVVDRLLSICALRREGLDSPRFCLDIAVGEMLAQKLSAEFSFTQGTLFEALQQIGEYIHAIPRLIPNVTYDYEYDESGNVINTTRNDYTDWNIITFDFLGETKEHDKTNYSILDAEHPMEDFATNFVSNIQNATQSNYDGNTTITEPFIGGYLSTRTESSNFEVSNNSCVFKTRKKIRSIISIKVNNKGKIKDITPNVIEKASFNTKSTYTTGDTYANKAFFLYYTEGEKNIYNLEYLRQSQTFMDDFNNQEAIKNILGLDETIDVETYIKNLSVQIEYIPYQDFKARQYKTLLDETSEDLSLFYNQQANEVDVDAYGESINFALLKTGNQKLSKTKYYKNLKNMPRCGHLMDNYYIFRINRELNVFTPTKTTISLTKDYNEMYAFNGVKKNIRQYEISEKECINRNPDYQEFCFIDTSFDMEDIFNDSSLKEFQNNIIERLSTLGFATNKNLTQMANKLANNGAQYKPISYAIVKTESAARDGTRETHCFLIPTACFPFGRSIVLSFAMDDNYSAGTTVVDARGFDKGNDDFLDSYALENYIPYGNEFGRFDTMGVVFGADKPLLNYESDIKSNSKYLYKVDESNINTDSTIVNFENHPFLVDKDSREQIQLTTQLNFVTHNKNIIIGSAMAHTTPLTTSAENSYKYVLFYNKPNKFEELINVEDIINMGKLTATPDENKKFIKIEPITSCINACGYGIIDSNNRLCVYIDEPVRVNEITKPIYLMFRSDI
ncbi:MAG: hypothetical protein IKA31_02070 [Clostridia bacterium]|nr:hypothetical protein [Clostridia bacterium]